MGSPIPWKGGLATTTDRTFSRQDLERILRSLCRCDGLKDMAVVAALIVVAASLAIRLATLPAVATKFS